ncbi:flavodoxin-dependent (E)-4-hydroxy-3-methylbut-2-enyl-diphosphate synthase [Acidobacteriota bacterium]
MKKKNIFDFQPDFVRRRTRQIRIGDVDLGGNAPIVVQSMTKTDTRDVRNTVLQTKRLVEAGCKIVRVAVPDSESVKTIKEIKKKIKVPLIADIHFDYRLALASLKAGVDGLRINPGNIGSKLKVREVVKAAREKAIPIRIGVNSGSLEKDLLRKYHGATPEAMKESALRHVRILEDSGFDFIKISVKSSDVLRTLRAYQLLSEEVDYPFHAGISEAGGIISGTVKSTAGLALLLSQGLADTIRVSLTAPPEEEVRVGYLILSSLGLYSRGVNFISCPVCGRCEVDMAKISAEIEQHLSSIKESLDVAVMGCMVNGPGEAKEADIGVACGRGKGVIFKKGKLYSRLEEQEIVSEFVKEVRLLAKGK